MRVSELVELLKTRGTGVSKLAALAALSEATAEVTPEFLAAAAGAVPSGTMDKITIIIAESTKRVAAPSGTVSSEVAPRSRTK